MVTRLFVRLVGVVAMFVTRRGKHRVHKEDILLCAIRRHQRMTQAHDRESGELGINAIAAESIIFRWSQRVSAHSARPVESSKIAPCPQSTA